MKSEIFLNASKDNGDFVYASSATLVEQGVPENAVMDVMIGMAEGYEEQGFYVEMEVEVFNG